MSSLLKILRHPAVPVLFRYGVVGIASIAIQVLFLFVWVSVFKLNDWYLVGAVIGFCIALLIAFLLQKYWTFRDTGKEKRAQQFVLYGVIACVNLVLNLALLALTKSALETQGVDFFDTWYVVVQSAILGVGALVSFLANRFITFKDAPGLS